MPHSANTFSDHSSTSLRVLHVIARLNLKSGGPTSALAGLAAAQVAAGLKVSVLAVESAPEEATLAKRLTESGVNVRLIAPPRRAFLPGSTFVAEVTQMVGHADIVHLHGVWEEIVHTASRCARIAGVPYLFTPHGMLDIWALNQKWLKKWIYRRLRLDADLRHARAVHFAADRERDQSLLALPSRWEQSLVEPFGIETAEFDPLPPSGRFRARFPQLAGKKIIAFLGRIHAGKGVEYLLPAMAHIKNENATLIIAGPDSGGFGQEMRSLAARQKVEEKVTFVGMLYGQERIELLVDADLFALPSEHENFGIVVAEALAAGCPAVVSDEVNVCLALKTMDAGAVVAMMPSHDLPARLAASIDTQLNRGRDPMERERIRRAALAAFDWDAIGRRWVEHYRQLLVGKRPS